MTTAQLDTTANTPPGPSPKYLQCPNPDCGSGQIKTSVKRCVYKPNKIKLFNRLSTSNYRQKSIPFFIVQLLIATIWASTTMSFQANHQSPLFWLTLATYGILFGLCLIGFILFLKLPNFKMYVHKCQDCEAGWQLPEYRTEIDEKIYQWASNECQGTQYKSTKHASPILLSNLAAAELRRHNYEAALVLAERSTVRTSWATTIIERDWAIIQNNYAAALFATGMVRKAASIVIENRNVCLKARHWQAYAETLVLEALCEAHEGFTIEVKALTGQALLMYVKMGDLENIALCLEILAGIAVDNDEMVVAAHLYGAAEAYRETSYSQMPAFCRASYDQHVRQLDWQLDSSVKAVAWEAGRQMPPLRIANLAINRK